MGGFTKPLIHTLSDLETNGTDFTINGQIYNNKSYLICGTADLPAMSIVMNCIELIVDQTATLRCQICHFSHHICYMEPRTFYADG